jgi:methylated-DNA-protein-cysteine methyltransferase-like protein
MDPSLAQMQRQRLEAEGLVIDEQGYIKAADRHFHTVGVRRNIRWAEG